MRGLLAFLIRRALRVRYDISFEGLDQIRGQKGVFILPNHPAEMDPVIMSCFLWSQLTPHPVPIEDVFEMPGVNWLMKQAGAIPMPNMDSGAGPYKRLRVEKSIANIATLLADGENVLLYPAGRLMRGELEDLRSTSAVADILAQVPQAKILRVRIRGLLGSSFSWVAHQNRPPLGSMLLRGIKYALANLLLFCPKRKVTVTVELCDPADVPAERVALNRWLENWYNEPGPEPLTQVSYLCWTERLFPYQEQAEQDQVDLTQIDASIRAQVCAELARLSGREPDEVQPGQSIERDLDLDSLASADLVSWIDETFHVSDVDNADLRRVSDVMAAAAHLLKGSQDGALPPQKGWEEARRPQLRAPALDQSIVENFLWTTTRMGPYVAMADPARGAVSYAQARIAVILLAEVIRTREEQNIGIMLPAACGTNLLIMATMLAGKTPVLINWTVGDTNLRHVIEIAGVKVIYTSEAFLDRLDAIDFDYLAAFIQPLEVLKGVLTLGHKLSALRKAKQTDSDILAHFAHERDLDKPAVILFTSGSESVPKGVPLSHRNILANVTGCMQHVALDSSDILYGFLPPFHSFGFTVTSMLPLLSGLKVCYHPNPTESRRLASGIARWQATLICGTPTFVAGICRAAEPSQLHSLRLILTGAEKTPDSLFQALATQAPGAALLEGYGITECAPVLTLNQAQLPRCGVGAPLGDVQIQIVHPETHEPVPPGGQGLILVRGPSIFAGYLALPENNPFLQHDGASWYNTGDLGFLNELGQLTLSGRLKRFVKIAGEMISLPAMEAALLAAWQPADDAEGPALAIVAYEADGERPELVLGTIFDKDQDAANEALREAGFGSLARVRRVVTVPEIPQLGSGKTDYRSLKAALAT